MELNFWTFLQHAVVNFISAFAQFFPLADSNNLANFTTYISTWRGYMSSASWIIPVNVLLSQLGIILAIEGTLFAYRAIKLVVGWITLGFIND